MSRIKSYIALCRFFKRIQSVERKESSGERYFNKEKETQTPEPKCCEINAKSDSIRSINSFK